MSQGKYPAVGLQSGCTANSTGMQYKLLSSIAYEKLLFSLPVRSWDREAVPVYFRKGKEFMPVKDRKSYLSNVFFILLFLAYLAVTLFLFHRQTVRYAGRYISDITDYLSTIQGIEVAYRFPYPVLFRTGSFFMLFTTPEHALAFAATFLNGLSVLVLKWYLDSFLEVKKYPGRSWLSILLTFSLLFVSMLFPPSYLGHYNEIGENYLYRYRGTFTPNPYHNATYLAARPFSIPAFFLFAEVLGIYEKENKWFHPKYLLFSLFLLMTTMTKPSFTLILCAAAGILMLYRLIAGQFQGVKAFFQLGIYFIPTFLVLIYQFVVVFEPDNAEAGIGFAFLKAWSTASGNIPLSILFATAFPLTVLALRGKEKTLWTQYRFSWQFLLIGLATLLFLYEKGIRMPHLNFAWGYMHGLFFTYTVSLICLAKATLTRSQPLWKLTLQWGVYAAHLICGIDYFVVLLRGGLYL